MSTIDDYDFLLIMIPCSGLGTAVLTSVLGLSRVVTLLLSGWVALLFVFQALFVNVPHSDEPTREN